MAIKPIELIIKARDEASSVLGSLQGKLTAVAATIAAYFGVTAFIGAVKGAADLEAGMSRVLAATGASAEEMKLLRQAAENAGANTKYTSTEAASALENLAKAGLSAKDAIAALPAVLNLAQAGDIGLGTASEYLTKAVMGMGLAFTDAGRVADVLAMGANATNTSVTGLAQALSYAAPLAQSLGLSLESTVATMGKFADAGIDASRAGTALNSIMAQFSDPASKFRAELGAAGITTNNFEAALHQLAKTGPSGAKAINAVGTEAGPALRALLNQGMGALDDLTAKLKNAEGSAAATAKVMQDNLNGSLSGLSSAWDTVKNALAAPVLPVLKDGVDQLAGAFKSAVTDGTIQKFGDAIAVSFQSGIKWARDFLAQIDFTKVAADLRAFADRSSEVFSQIGEHATAAGNSAKLAYEVMSAGTNTVLAVVYLVGSAFAGVASNIQSGTALIMEGFAKVTFGKMSASFKEAAADVRLSAEATWAASEALGAKSEAAFLRVADGAQGARDGFAALAGAATGATPAITAAAAAVDDMGNKLEATRQKSHDTQKATEEKKVADEAATVAVRQLKDEYAALISSGNLQAAAEKLKEVNKALQGTPPAAKDAIKAAQEAAQAIADAFQRMGVTSSAELKLQATNALRDYNIIKTAGTSTAEDIKAAFLVYAEKAIAANKGVASESIKTEAAMRGLSVEVDSAGKTIVSVMGSGANAVRGLGEQFRMTTEQIRALEDAQDRLAMKYRLSADYTERQIALLEREAAAIQKVIDTENKRLNRDSQGFSIDPTTGQRVNIDVQTQRSVYENAKSQGLSEADALKIMNQFMSQNGQKTGWGGANLNLGENWGTELQKAIDKLVLANAANASKPTRADGGGNAYVTNYTIDGSQKSIRLADQQSQSTVDDLIRQLAAARGASIR